MADPRVVRAIIRIGRRRRVPRRYIKAALETGIVESGLRNLHGGDGSSVGWRQETAQSYPGVNRRNVRASVNRFYNEARQHDHGQGAGRLAADVQRPRAEYRGRYGQVAGQASRILHHGAGSYTGGGGRGAPRVLSRASVSLTPGRAVTPGGLGVAALLQQSTAPPPAPVSAPPEPSFSAHNRLALPQGYSGIQSTGPPPAKQDTLAGQLQRIERLTGSTVPRAQVNVSGRNRVAPGVRQPGGGRAGRMPHGRRHYPLGRGGRVIGVPYQGTHTLGNWQSDNAVDIATPKGTPVVAVVGGVISPGGLGFGRLTGGGGRFAGLRLHLRGHGNTYFYQHLSRYAHGIRPGAHVKRGQIIGYSGVANGVAHLHFAQEHGDPRRTLRR